MTRSVQAIADFRDYSPLQLVDFAHNVVAAMTGNPTYPTPDVPMANITSMANALGGAYQAAQSNTGSTTDYNDVATYEKQLINLLRQQVRYVNHIAYNNEALILTSGFHVSSSETKPANKPGKPAFSVQPLSDAGSADITIEPLAEAKSFMVITAAETVSVSVSATGITSTGAVTIISDTHRKIVVSGLESGQRYRVWIVATGTAGLSQLSDMKTFVTQ